MNERIARLRVWFTVVNVEWLLFGLAIVFNLVQLALSWNHPILGEHAFRQTQTAISAFWIAKGGSWLAYPTPVLGAPWSIPFEFPLYQWLAAGAAVLLPWITLDQAGRLVSELFFLACLWPAWRIATNYRDGPSMFRLCSVVVLLSPFYVFWSRSFMMESAVLFFSIWFVAALDDFLRRPNAYGFAEMTLIGSLAACIKITTFVGFAYAGALIVCGLLLTSGWRSWHPKRMLPFLLTAVAVALSMVALLLWLHFGDDLKRLNWYGENLVSSAADMRKWNFGTLAQRKSWEIWHVALLRAPNEALGSWIVFLLMAFYALARLAWLQKVVFLALIFLYLSVFFTFTNVHFVHNYYQYANSIFLLASIGYVLHAGMGKDRFLALALLGVVCLVEFAGFYRYFYHDMVEPNRQEQTLLATFVRDNVPDDKMLVIFGLAWSPEVPYYAERRALMIPTGVSESDLERLSRQLDTATGGVPIGAVIMCPNGFQSQPGSSQAYRGLVSKLVTGKTAHTVGYCIVST
jgi:hypothetical protein